MLRLTLPKAEFHDLLTAVLLSIEFILMIGSNSRTDKQFP